jgi:hypothetical protein
MSAVLTIFNSKPDTYGNTYYAVRLHSHDGEPVEGKIQPDNVSTRDCREVLNWYIERQALPIREFNRLVKGWQYLGCTWEDIRAQLLARAPHLAAHIKKDST